MNKKLIKMKRWVITLFTLLIFTVYVFLQNNWIKIERIDVEINNLPEELKGLKIAHVSDIHIPKNAASIDKLVSKIRKEKPDIILMTGDIIDKSADINDPRLSDLCKSLASIADTFAVTGNHEIWNKNLERWREIVESSGVKILEDKVHMYKRNNALLAIMGLKDVGRYSGKNFDNISALKDMPKILLAHRPELFNTYSSETSGIVPDLVFSGHAHGGQFRIPLLNKGIIAPNQGFFPEYTSGLYVSKNGVQMFVSRGLGNSIIPVRLNNRPHLPIISLK